MIISSIDYSNLPSPFFTDDIEGEDALQPYLQFGVPKGNAENETIRLRRFSVYVEELSEEVRNSEQDSKVQILKLDTNDLYEGEGLDYGKDGKPDYNDDAITKPDTYEEYTGSPNLGRGLPVKLQKVYFMGERRDSKGMPPGCEDGDYDPKTDGYSAYFLCSDPIRQSKTSEEEPTDGCIINKRGHHGALGGTEVSWKSFDVGGSFNSSADGDEFYSVVANDGYNTFNKYYYLEGDSPGSQITLNSRDFWSGFFFEETSGSLTFDKEHGKGTIVNFDINEDENENKTGTFRFKHNLRIHPISDGPYADTHFPAQKTFYTKTNTLVFRATVDSLLNTMDYQMVTASVLIDSGQTWYNKSYNDGTRTCYSPIGFYIHEIAAQCHPNAEFVGDGTVKDYPWQNPSAPARVPGLPAYFMSDKTIAYGVSLRFLCKKDESLSTSVPGVFEVHAPEAVFSEEVSILNQPFTGLINDQNTITISDVYDTAYNYRTTTTTTTTTTTVSPF